LKENYIGHLNKNDYDKKGRKIFKTKSKKKKKNAAAAAAANEKKDVSKCNVYFISFQDGSHMGKFSLFAFQYLF
jgi:hypothetical protein